MGKQVTREQLNQLLEQEVDRQLLTEANLVSKLSPKNIKKVAKKSIDSNLDYFITFCKYTIGGGIAGLVGGSLTSLSKYMNTLSGSLNRAFGGIGQSDFSHLIDMFKDSMSAYPEYIVIGVIIGIVFGEVVGLLEATKKMKRDEAIKNAKQEIENKLKNVDEKTKEIVSKSIETYEDFLKGKKK